MVWATVRSKSCFCWLYRTSSLSTKIYNQSEFVIDYLVMSMCSFVSCVVGREYLLWPGVLLPKLCLPLPFILYSKAKLPCYSRYLLTSYFCVPVSYDERTSSLCVLVLEGLVDLYRTVQLWLLQHLWLSHKRGLPWCWTVCLGSKPRSFCPFWDCTQVLHFGLLLTMRATPFLLRDSCPQ